MADTSNSNDRMVARIRQWLRANGSKARYGEDDERVLRYILSQLTDRGLDKRPDDDKNVAHLHDIARLRLAPYDKEDRVS